MFEFEDLQCYRLMLKVIGNDFMRADGRTFHPRHTSDPAGTEDLDGRERPGGVVHKDKVGVETTTDIQLQLR